MTLPQLDSARVRLRSVSEDDTDAIFAVFSNPAAMRYWSHEPFADRARASAYIAEIHAGFARNDLFQWGIERVDRDGLIGTCTLVGIDWMHRRCSLGYVLHPSCWGQGLAGEAASLALKYALGTLKLHRVEADVDPRNQASRQLLGRLGFSLEGLQRERYRLYEEVQDAEMFGLLATDPQAARYL